MRNVRRFFFAFSAVTLLPVFGALGAPYAPGAEPAMNPVIKPTMNPAMRLAQAPAPNAEQEKKKREQQQRPQPPRPPGPPAAQPPRPPQAAPARPSAPPPAQRPVQAPPPPQRPVQAPPPPPPRQPQAPVQRPVQGPPPLPPGQPPHAPQNAPAQATPPAGPQHPAQGAPQAPVTPQLQRPVQVPPPAPPGQVPRAPQNAPAQATPPGGPQHPAQGAPPPPGSPPSQRPVQNAPTAAPNAPPNAPANAPQQRPAQGGPVRLPPPVVAPSASQMQPLRPTGGPAAIVPTSPQGQPVRRVDQLHAERHETVEGNQTIIREPDRVIVRENDGRAFIRHDENERFRYNARDVHVDHRGNDNVTTVVLPNGDRMVTVLSADGVLLRRSRFLPDGREIVIIDERPPAPGYNFYVELPPPVIRIPRERYIVEAEDAPPDIIYDTLIAPPVEPLARAYTLDEIRYSEALRERMPRIDIDTVNFEFGSWEIAPDQVDRLAVIAEAINRAVARNPREVFLIEGHTDAVGSDVDNLSLSDRRAETVALVLSSQFQVPPENLVTQGYGKQYLKIPTDAPERRNRRVTVRRITPLLAGGR